jgi:hypothetical protein
MKTLTYTNTNLQVIHDHFSIHIYTKYQQPIHPQHFLDFGHFLRCHYTQFLISEQSLIISLWNKLKKELAGNLIT